MKTLKNIVMLTTTILGCSVLVRDWPLLALAALVCIVVGWCR